LAAPSTGPSKSIRSLVGLDIEAAIPELGSITYCPIIVEELSIGPKKEDTQHMHITVAIVNKLIFPRDPPLTIIPDEA